MIHPLKVFLIDGSGSMRPAWDRAWEKLFELAKENPSAFVILVFKRRINLTDMQNLAGLNAIHSFDGLLLIDYGKVLSAKRNHKLKRVPEPDVTFSGYTPLNDAIIKTIELMEERYKRTRVPYEILVISDNRDSRSISNMRDVLATKERAKGLKKVAILPVGEFLDKYLEPYDEILTS